MITIQVSGLISNKAYSLINKKDNMKTNQYGQTIEEVLEIFNKNSRNIMTVAVSGTNLHFAMYHKDNSKKIRLRAFVKDSYKAIGEIDQEDVIEMFDGLNITVNDRGR